MKKIVLWYKHLSHKTADGGTDLSDRIQWKHLSFHKAHHQTETHPELEDPVWQVSHSWLLLWVAVLLVSTGFLKPGAHVKPGEIFTYRWTVPESVSPTADDPPCLTYLYFSAVEPIKDTSSGLVGPLLVCKTGVLNADATQVGLRGHRAHRVVCERDQECG